MSELKDRFPDPGPQPPRPNGPCPSTSEWASYGEWTKAADLYNTWLGKSRKHVVAKALGEIAERSTKSEPSPETRIIKALAVAFLDGAGMPDTSSFGGLFGLF